MAEDIGAGVGGRVEASQASTNAGVGAVCAAHPDRVTEVSCNECRIPLCQECQVTLGENVYCRPCVERSRASLRQAVSEMTRNPNYLGALGLGLVVALACAYGWGLITNALRAQLSLIAIGVGYAVGLAVVRGSGDKRGTALQVSSLLLTLIGIVGGLFFEFHFAMARVLAERHSQLQPDLATTLRVFPRFLAETGVMTWVIVAIGVWQGWTMPKAPDIDL